MRNYLSVFIIIIGTLLVLYLSWVSSPKIGGNPLVPNWIAMWVDAYYFDAIRTAVPMIFLGGMSGLLIVFNNLNMKWWWLAWGLLSLLVCIAEIGQFLRPLRSFDSMDILWGSVGSALGLLMVYVIRELTTLKK